MADKYIRIPGVQTDGTTEVHLLAHDNTDGTHSLGTYSGPGSGTSTVTGNVAAGATDSGNPVKVAGVYNSTLPTLTDGQRGNLQLNASGGVIIGGSTVASGSTDSGNPVKVGGVYNITLPTLTDGQRGNLQLNISGGLLVGGGTVAAASTDSGNPIKVGGVYNSTFPTLTTGQRGNLQLSSSGALVMAGKSGSAQAGSDARSNSVNTVFDDLGNSLTYITRNYGFNGSTYDRLRVPTISKTATATASGDTALWTPTSGKKFNLQRYQIQVTADVATSGGAVIDVVLRDSTTALAAAYSFYAPAAAGTTAGAFTTGWVVLAEGVGGLSAAANNVLNINLSAALTSGKVRVVVAGTEE